jgi:mono/diheme cytochrome c family protein
MKRLMILGLVIAVVVAVPMVKGDDDEGHKRHGSWWRDAAADIKPVRNELYRQECASCHMAYQPGLLPTASWRKLMAGLDNHFGENAELLAEDRQAILAYLEANAADTATLGRSAAFARTSPAGSIRITESRYFLRKHREVPKRFLAHQQIGSFSNCIACHRSADQGVYNEHDVNIPGVGRWDD